MSAVSFRMGSARRLQAKGVSMLRKARGYLTGRFRAPGTPDRQRRYIYRLLMILPCKLRTNPLYSRLKHGRSFPAWDSLEVEINSHCNRDCEWCPRYGDRSGIRKDEHGNSIRRQMPTDRFHSIIDQAAALGYRGKVCTHRLSESLLDPRYVDLARYVKAKGMKLLEDTNGDVLKRNARLCSELDGLVDSFCIGLYDYKDDEELEKEMAFWRGKFKRTRITFSLPQETCTIRIGSSLYDDGAVNKNDFYLGLECFMPTSKLLIRYDGEVSLCCEDDACSERLGNAFHQSLEEIWWAPRRIAIARQLLRSGGRRKFDICRGCFFPQVVDYRSSLSRAPVQ